MVVHDIALWDVDTQHDFMDEKGSLYVPGAEKIKAVVQGLISFGRQNQIPIFGSVDEHKEFDPEFKIFPEHCVKGTPGYDKIFLPGPGELYFKKNTIDIFANPEAKEFIMNAAKSYIVFGVATEFCIKEVVLGMRRRNIRVYLVIDAIKGINKEMIEEALCEMIRAGTIFIDSIGLRKILDV